MDSIDDHSNTFLTGCLHSICNGDSTVVPRQTLMPNSSAVSTEDPNLKDAFKLVQQDMNQLSLTERDQAYEELHGVRQIVEENPERIAYSLYQMEEEISKISRKSAYLLAEQMSKQFVHDYKFRLRFLRSCWFDPVLTAQKFVNFFETKLELFGPEKLTRSITISDLGEGSLPFLRSGKCQFLPHRDRSGRAVVIFFPRMEVPTETNVDALLRTAWYYLMTVAEDEQTQRQGVVVIHYWLATDGRQKSLKLPRIEFPRKAIQISHSAPIRNEGFHFCFNDSKIISLVSTIARGVSSRHRTRMRFHNGSDSECQFALMTYGIPVHALPLTGKGHVKVDNHLKWLQRRSTMERMMMNGIVFNGILLPSKDDILLGRGKPIQNSTGNEHLREIVTENIDEYQKATRGGKSSLASMIVKQINQSSGRFLKEDEMMGWIEVSDDIAIEKVCCTFRAVRAKIVSYKSKETADQDRKRVKH